jgi:hypothetical protein
VDVPEPPKVDKVVEWRQRELRRLFPEMEDDHVDELAHNHDKYMLETAARLARDGCPPFLAYRIMRS